MAKTKEDPLVPDVEGDDQSGDNKVTGEGRVVPGSVTSAPRVDLPAAHEKTVSLRILKDIDNVYIGGKRYTAKKGTTVNWGEEAAYTFRGDGSAV